MTARRGDEPREAILARIRRALDGADAPPEVARAYRRRGSLRAEEREARFVERLVEYGVHVERSSPDVLEAVLAERLRARGARRMLAPPGVPKAWRVGEVDWIDGPVPAKELDRLDGVLTGCAVAVAETGTVVLDGGPGQGPRAGTLVPDYHLCVVSAEQVLELVPEAVEALEPAIRAGRALTLVSGPSATSDIELMRVAGVHGPRTLDVVLVGTADASSAAGG